MGYVRADISLRNPKAQSVGTLEARALVDTGALMLCLPSAVSDELGLSGSQEREVTTADGRSQRVPYVGPVEVSFGDRSCYVGALVMGDEILLGAVPMEDMDLVVVPSQRKLIPNPEHPNLPHALAK